MYRIYANSKPLHHPNQFADGVIVSDPILSQSLNAHGSLEFSVPPTNPLYGEIATNTTTVTVLGDTGEIWRGRAISIDKGWDNFLRVYCEGELAYLTDSIYRPYVHRGSVDRLFNLLVINHNGQVDASRRFTAGDCTVTDPNDNIYRAWSEAGSTWEIFKTKLIDTLGGFLRVRVENGTRYLDYLADSDTESDQEIAYGSNLLDLTRTADGAEMITRLIPYGARFEQDDTRYEEEPQSGGWDGNRLTISGATDYVSNAAAEAIYGAIYGTQIFDDITIESNLITAANAALTERIAAASAITIDARAFDRSAVENVSALNVGDYVRVKSAMHDIDIRLMVRSKRLPLMRPGDAEIVLGAGRKTLTDLRG